MFMMDSTDPSNKVIKARLSGVTLPHFATLPYYTQKNVIPLKKEGEQK